MKEYDIYIPLFYNDGSRIEARKTRRLQEFLLKNFEGFTYFPRPNQGFWKMGGVTFRDEIVIYRVLADESPQVRALLRRLKNSLKRSLDQEEILIIIRDVETL
jgi:hypothetical protein